MSLRSLSGISGLSFESIFLSALVILPSPVAHSVFSFFCLKVVSEFAKVYDKPDLVCLSVCLSVSLASDSSETVEVSLSNFAR